MDSNCTQTRIQGDVLFAERECTDGMCCFTCVIPPNGKHIGVLKCLLKKGTGATGVKLLVTGEGCKNELYDSCMLLDFTISGNGEAPGLNMDLRCSIYKRRPCQCEEYPDNAGMSLERRISGPCIFNEYAASDAYKKLVYKRGWDAYYAILDQEEIIKKICVYETPSLARETLMQAKGVRLATITVMGKEQDFILIPVPKNTHNVLYTSKRHLPITTIKQAYLLWQEKIKSNLENHYGPEWETRLATAIETEEKDASKRGNEDTTGNPEC